MVNLNLNYDKTLHQKTFILKGEEAYARTTDTLLTINRFNNSTSEFGYVRLGVEIDVLRETGDDSVIILYNGDTILKTYNWSAGQSKIIDGASNDTNGIKLAYGVEHNIYAVYMGNKQCLKSKSKPVIFTEPIPASINTKLTTNANTNYNHGADVVCPVTLSFAELNTVNNVLNGQTVKYYVDDVFYDSVTASENSRTITCTITGLSDGLHTIKAVFEGSDYLYGCEVSFEVSVGYNIELVDYSAIMVNGYADNYVTAKVTDMFNTPIANGSVTITNNSSSTGTTDSNGVVTFKSSSGYNNFTLSYGGVTTDSISVPLINVTAISFDRDELSTLDGKEGSFEISVDEYTWTTESSTKAGIPVVLTGGITGTYYTNYNGIATIPYGDNVDTTIVATVGGVSKILPVSNVLQYWIANTPSNQWNRDIELSSMAVHDIRGGFRLSDTTTLRQGRLIFNAPIEEDVSLSFDVVKIGKITGIVVAGISTSVVGGDKVKCVFDSSNGVKTLYVNNEVVGTSTDTNAVMDVKLSDDKKILGFMYIIIDYVKVQYEVLD